MPVTPAVWTPKFQVNGVDTDAAGLNDQQSPSVVHLANGNILVVWQSNSHEGLGDPAGVDIMGRILSASGAPVTPEFRLNRIYTGDNERHPVVVAEDDGGFTLIYEDRAGAQDNSIRLERCDALGLLSFATTVAGDTTSAGAPDYLKPVVAGSLLTPGVRMIAYVIDNGGGAHDVAFRTWHPGDNTLGTEKIIFQGTAGAGAGIDSLDATPLATGGFAVAFSDSDSAAESDVELHIFSSAGNELFNVAVSTASGRNDAVGVAGLGNHTIAVTWETGVAGSRDIVGQIVGEDGGLIGGPFQIAAGAGDQAGVSIARLPYGGFAAAWIEDGTKVFAQSFSASGAKYGEALLAGVVPGGASSVDVAALSDGRFTVSWTANERGDHDVFTTILDARDNENNATDDDNLITGTVNGDFIQDSVGDDTILAGAGDDTVAGGPGSDLIDGGAGRDKIDYHLAPSAVQVKLAGESAGSYALNDKLLGFEDAAGTAFGDLLRGTTGANLLQGLDGNDTLYGGDGDDTLEGGKGVNDLYGGAGADKFWGITGTSRARYDDANWGDLTVALSDPSQNTGIAAGDTFFGLQGVFTGDGNDKVTGDAQDNLIQTGGGNDTLDGMNGADTLVGGAGDDLYKNVTSEDPITESANGGIDTVETAEGYTILFQGNLENITLTGSANVNAVGNAADNVIIGNAGHNQLIGGFGNDTLIANDGHDTLYGGDGNDSYEVRAGDIVVESAGGGYDTVKSDQSALLADYVEKLILTGSGNIDGVGNAIANLMAGNSGNNKLYGYGGADTLKGGEGNDTLDGGGGTDELRGAGGDDVYINPTGDTIIENSNGGTDTVKSNATFSLETIANVENLTLAGSADIDGTGNALNNLITGNAGANVLDGKAGKDILIGGAGNDTLTGGDGADTFRFGTSGMGIDRITDFNTAVDRFDLTGLAFTGLNEANGNTVLTYGGGKIVAEGVTGLSLAQWNALVLPSGGAAKAAPSPAHDTANHSAAVAPGHYQPEPALDLPHVHHVDFSFA